MSRRRGGWEGARGKGDKPNQPQNSKTYQKEVTGRGEVCLSHVLFQFVRNFWSGTCVALCLFCSVGEGKRQAGSGGGKNLYERLLE